MIAMALRQSLQDGSLQTDWRRNLLAGVTTGIVAIPLSMGLAIAVGVPPQHGLYTAIIAGLFIAVLGGSRVNVSGPTAAFVVVLLPIVNQHGLSGLMLAGAMAGVLLMLMGALRFGRVIQVIPYPVIIGFTAGIGWVIASFQLPDLLGLQLQTQESHYLLRMREIITTVPQWQFAESLVAAVTLALLIVWKRLPGRIPSYMAALVLASVFAAVMNRFWPEADIATLASRFSYVADGVVHRGVPSQFPMPQWPWTGLFDDGWQEGLALCVKLLPAAFAIAVLGALESLLCASVADGMTGQRHDPDSELLGQGLGNVIVSCLSGIPATAAIARTATNVRAGATTPVASMVHGVTVLLAMLVLAPLLGFVPMAAIAAVLLMVAWNMAEARHVVRVLRHAPRADAAVLLVVFLTTVIFDMQIAVATGLVLASLLFMQRMIALTDSRVLEHHAHPHTSTMDPSVIVYDVDGPLFFGAAHKALKIISAINPQVRHVVLDLRDVSMMDLTAMMALESLLQELQRRHVGLYAYRLQSRVQAKLQRLGLLGPEGIRPLTDRQMFETLCTQGELQGLD